MTLRRLWVLVSKIPRDSNTARLLHGEAAEWVTTDYLLAQIFNEQRRAHAGKRVPDSQLIHPPGSKKARPPPKPKPERKLGFAELDALFTGAEGG